MQWPYTLDKSWATKSELFSRSNTSLEHVHLRVLPGMIQVASWGERGMREPHEERGGGGGIGGRGEEGWEERELPV